jgi:hypothetical protein
MSPLRRPIHLIILSSKIPVTGRVCEESVKVRTSKSPVSRQNLIRVENGAIHPVPRIEESRDSVKSCLEEREGSL